MKKKTFYLILVWAMFLFVCCEKTTISPEKKGFGLLLEEPLETFHQKTFLGPYGAPIAITREQYRFLGSWRFFDEYGESDDFYCFCINDTCYHTQFYNGTLVFESHLKYSVIGDSIVITNENPWPGEEPFTKHKYYFNGKDTLTIEKFQKYDLDVSPPIYYDVHLKRIY